MLKRLMLLCEGNCIVVKGLSWNARPAIRCCVIDILR